MAKPIKLTDIRNEGYVKVMATDYYGEFYQAYPDAKDGDKVLVVWPDDVTTIETLHVYKGRGSAQVDMNGIPDSFPTQKLSITHVYHGVNVEVSLKGLWIKKAGSRATRTR